MVHKEGYKVMLLRVPAPEFSKSTDLMNVKHSFSIILSIIVSPKSRLWTWTLTRLSLDNITKKLLTKIVNVSQGIYSSITTKHLDILSLNKRFLYNCEAHNFVMIPNLGIY